MRTPGSLIEKSLAFLVTRRHPLVRAVALDEVQKIPDWSALVKRLWEEPGQLQAEVTRGSPPSALRSLARNYPHRTCPDPRCADAGQFQKATHRPSRHVEQQPPKSVLPFVRHGRLLDHLNRIGIESRHTEKSV